MSLVKIVSVFSEVKYCKKNDWSGEQQKDMETTV